ncbi:hypothetical protein [Streptomyces sp. NPDC006668]|uniref:hypothetical protein n=1 Tax=Streptomyces sp. NPDC006668 TaxID=3156903 RepID=UPI0033CF3627
MLILTTGDVNAEDGDAVVRAAPLKALWGPWNAPVRFTWSTCVYGITHASG